MGAPDIRSHWDSHCRILAELVFIVILTLALEIQIPRFATDVMGCGLPPVLVRPPVLVLF